MAGPNRKLAAVLSADAVGYSRLMQDDEAATVETIKAYRGAIGRVIARHGGRVVDSPGDNILAAFPSAVEAVQAAVEIQKAVDGRNAELAAHRRMPFRVGVNLGDIIEEEDGRIYGDGVNIAARMEALAEEGGICVSSTVYEAVEGKIDFGFDFLGEQPVKNIAKPVRVYRVRAEPGAPARKRGKPPVRPAALIAAGAVVAALAGLWAWQMAERPAGAPAATERAETADASPEASPPILPDGPSIAVLPFTNFSGDAEQDYFADGITEDIISALSRFREFLVIARNSTFVYKNKAVDIQEVGRALGVRYVLEGSVRRQSDRIRIAAQLIDTATGGHVWTDTYDRELTDVFAVQEEITRDIAGALGMRIEEIERELVREKPTENLAAYDLVLLAAGWDLDPTPENHARARDLLERAVALDPTYARAYADLAWVYSYEFDSGLNTRPDALARARRMAKRAVELAPSNPWAHFVLSQQYFQSGEIPLFEAEAERALALNPNNADILAWTALRLQQALGLDRLSESAEMARQAMRLNPHHNPEYRWSTVREFYFTGRYDEALAELSKMALPDDYVWNLIMTAMIEAQAGHAASARAARDRLLEIKPDYTLRWHLDVLNAHESYWPGYIEGAEKAGLPLGDLDSLRAERRAGASRTDAKP